MFTLKDVINIDAENFQRFLSTQRAINSGMWGLQGSYGRSMMEAINAGYCLLGPEGSAALPKDYRDYYGNTIPSRNDVKPGTKGSYEFVVEKMGWDWAREMAAV